MPEESTLLRDKCSINCQGAGITVYIGTTHRDAILEVLPASVDSGAPMYMMQFDKIAKTITLGVGKL